MKQAIRVAHLTTVHPRHDIRIFRKESVSLAQSGHEVHLLVSDGNGEERLAGVLIHDIGRCSGRALRMILAPLRMWRTARRMRAHVYHFHDPELLGVGLLLRLGGAHVIYDAHEDVPRAILSKYWIRPAFRKVVAVVLERFEDFVAAHLSAVVTATPHITQRFRRVQPRSVTISNYPLSEELALPRSNPVHSRTLCYVGGIGLIRGAAEMLRAVELADAKLILAGPFESPDTEKLLRSLPGWRNVDYRGVVNRDEVRRIFEQSQAGLLFFHPEPNHVEAQPNKMFEYMSAGLPVLASNFPVWRNLLEDNGAGLCADPLDPKDIAAVVTRILDDPESARAMGSRGLAAVMTHFQWRFEQQKLLDLYSDLLHQT